MSLFHSIIPTWWQENGLSGNWYPGNAVLADRVWVCNRCIQLNSQQIASMPLEFHGAPEPAWCSSPDPNLYPNGVGDALHAIVAQIYGWGFACLYITDFYADGYARRWTVLDSSALSIKFEDGRAPVQVRRGDPEPAADRADRPQPRRRRPRHLGHSRLRAGRLGAARRRQPVDDRQPGRHPAGGARSRSASSPRSRPRRCRRSGARRRPTAAGCRRCCRPSSTSRRSRSTRPTWRCSTRRSSTPRCSPRPSACRR